MDDQHAVKLRRARKSFFNRRFSEIHTAIDYDKSWEMPAKGRVHVSNLEDFGRIQYYFSAVGLSANPQIAAMEPGDVAKSIDENGRKIIFVQTRFGPCGIHVSSIDVDGDVYGFTIPIAIRRFKFENQTSPTSAAMMASIIGSPNGITNNNPIVYRNIGQWLELMASAFVTNLSPNFNLHIVRPSGNEQ